jgi:hypothetical protein
MLDWATTQTVSSSVSSMMVFTIAAITVVFPEEKF